MLKIDALYLMLLVEFSLLLLLSAVYFFFKKRKYSMLYQKTLQELAAAKDTIAIPQATKEQPDEKTEEPAEQPKETIGQPEQEPETAEEQPAMEKREEMAAETPQEPHFLDAIDDTADDDTLRGTIKKLRRIINFQKNKMLDFMCFKDIFEGAQKKLGYIQQSNQDLQDRMKLLINTCERKEEIEETVALFENNNSELESYVGILNKENETLAGKFRVLEEELKKLWEEAEYSEGVDESKFQEIMNEKNEIAGKLKEFEEKLKEKSKLVEDMQTQYEDLEKEYMILYQKDLDRN